jgi:hypothetical protein
VNTAIDATINPDFSQVESDIAQIGANERFALFFPEKRPFFLEAIELFSTEIRAVYTRTITSPRWGARATGKFGHTAYTVLVADDRGGGSVILPGPNFSGLADQEFESIAAIGRVRHEFGSSFISFLATDREIEDGGSNRVFGPDFRWAPSEKDTVTGQLLFSQSQTPNRPELAAEWNGQKLADHAGVIWWSHTTRTWDWFVGYWDFGDEFRADNGFLPQVGYRENYGEVGHTFRPTKGFFSRLRPFLIADYQAERDGSLIFRQISPGAGMYGLFSSFIRLRVGFDKVRAGEKTFDRTRLIYEVSGSPSRVFNRLGLNGDAGEQVDFDNSRRGDGATINLFAVVRPTDHLELRFDGGRRWLNVEAPDANGRLFTASIARLRTQYTFTARAFLRVIGQYVETKRNPELYTFEVSRKSGDFSGSVLLAYKLNWQSVLFLGYGDTRTLSEEDTLERAGRQLFLKLSYAFQL